MTSSTAVSKQERAFDSLRSTPDAMTYTDEPPPERISIAAGRCDGAGPVWLSPLISSQEMEGRRDRAGEIASVRRNEDMS